MTNYQDIFHISKWVKATPAERLKALQALENDFADQQERPSCTVIPHEFNNSKGGGKTMGCFVRSTYMILISKKQLEQNTSTYSLVDTVLHEGRHAFQYYMTLKHPDGSHNRVDKWRKNFEVYIRSDECIFHYRFQPVERDAHDYADYHLSTIFNELEKKIGFTNLGYEEYISKKNHVKVLLEQMAIKEFGKNYIREIDQTIDDLYSLKNSLSLILEDAFNERKDLSLQLDKDVDLER